MRPLSRRFAVALLATACSVLVAWAQPPVAPPPRPVLPGGLPDLSSDSRASAVIGGKKVEYRVTTDRLPVIDRTGKAKGHMFFIAYTRAASGKPVDRPLTFCFNGGPGSSSCFVHLSAFGPRHLAVSDDGKDVPKPAKLVDNEYSLLDVTDLVFIDPISTGYSRAEKDDEAKLFHGLEEDTQSVGDFIRDYVAKYGRATSPTFIAGESYGTTRASALTAYLQKTGGVSLRGIMLISTVLDFATISFGPGNDLPYQLFLPTYTAAALHHGKVEGKQEKLLAEAEAFANGPYAEALKKGKDLSEEQRKTVAADVAKLTGLSSEYVLKNNLRVSAGAFRAELLRDAKELIGRYDARVKAKSTGGKGGFGDPSSALTSPPLAECLNSYLTEDLGLRTNLKYNTLARVGVWNYGMPRGKATVVPRLKAAMEKDENLRVFVAAGYADLATPYLAAKYTMENLGPPALRDRVTMAYYEGGHMMYTVRESHKRLKDDMARFIAGKER
jgi:carboxypeptidase C (cathepsin A)